MRREVRLAYLAGVMDGEGHIGIKRSAPLKCQSRVSIAYCLRVQVKMSHVGPLRLFCGEFGGSVAKEGRPKPNRKDMLCWGVTANIAEQCLLALRPYLTVKAKVADVALEFRDLQHQSASFRNQPSGSFEIRHRSGTLFRLPSYRHSDEYLALCDALYREVRRLNAVGAVGKEVQSGK